MRIKINSVWVEVEAGATIFQAAKSVGIDIPVMCFNNDLEHFTSCMVCLVKDSKTGKLMPSCSVKAEAGMEIITDDSEVLESRKMALELLLSEHIGDCEAPCRVACPAYMDIPLMNRLLEQGKTAEAMGVVMHDIALPSVLGRICPAPCEGVCRRKPIDGAVSICMLKRYAGDYGNFVPSVQPSNGKSIAVVGSGIAGLAAAFHLAQRGYKVDVFEKDSQAGGMLRYTTSEDELPKSILDNEIDRLQAMGVDFKCNMVVDKNMFGQLVNQYSSVIIASGAITHEQLLWGIPTIEKGFSANDKTYQSGTSNVFVIGTALKPGRLAVKMLAQGKEVAFSVHQFINNKQVNGEPKRFNSRFGRLKQNEFSEYLKESLPGNRLEPNKGFNVGFSLQEMQIEASRCLHCDCRKPETCKLRSYAQLFNVEQKIDQEQRLPVTKEMQHRLVVFEPGKCIKCGICVRLTAKYKEQFGFTFIGRGFDVRIGIPFNQPMSEGLKMVAYEVADACPTGAISRKNTEE
jgi:ferredoxin